MRLRLAVCLPLLMTFVLVNDHQAGARGIVSSRYCGPTINGLAVVAYGPTSCPFARKTANTWLRHGAPRPRYFRIYSPVTHRRYRMYCRTWHGHGDGNDYQHGLCTGANRARVEILS